MGQCPVAVAMWSMWMTEEWQVEPHQQDDMCGIHFDGHTSQQPGEVMAVYVHNMKSLLHGYASEQLVLYQYY